MRYVVSLVVVVSIFFACATIPGPSTTAKSSHPTDRPAVDARLHATLWQQTSAEYRLLTQSLYSMAKLHLERALVDKQWTAEPSQKDGFQNFPPAVIMDVDETVLDTSVFQATLIKDGVEYSYPLWKSWINGHQTMSIPGAVEFISFAQARGVTVFFVTNRRHTDEKETRANLSSTGISLPETPDTVLMRGERSDWGWDKATRRRYIAESYRVLMLIGDDLGDFISESTGTPQGRISEALKHNEWGTKWIVLPNAVYGSWVSSLYNFESQLDRDEILKRKFERLTFFVE
ncbi:MAG TPA: HAD family acid phosphatase [Candidatus Binatia bacterium]|nr:HAD family acid phosphatase [Candidatus Binatia bacterium]